MNAAFANNSAQVVENIHASGQLSGALPAHASLTLYADFSGVLYTQGPFRTGYLSFGGTPSFTGDGSNPATGDEFNGTFSLAVGGYSVTASANDPNGIFKLIATGFTAAVPITLGGGIPFNMSLDVNVLGGQYFFENDWFFQLNEANGAPVSASLVPNQQLGY
jgi:hypothetical protein